MTTIAAVDDDCRRRRSAAEDELVRLATLLGTYSLAGGDSAAGGGSRDIGDAVDGKDAPAVQSCGSASAALRALFSPSSSEASTFPSLLLDSDPHHPHHHHVHAHSKDRKEVEAHASSNLARPVELIVNNVPRDTDSLDTTESTDLLDTDDTTNQYLCTDGGHTTATVGSTADLLQEHVKADNDDDAPIIDPVDGTSCAPSAACDTTIGPADLAAADGDVKPGGVNPNAGDGEGEGLTRVSDPALIPPLLLRNLSSSFALLVDARLRAYGTILAGHAASLVGDGTDPALAPDDCDDDDGGESSCSGSGSVAASSYSCVQAAAERKLSALMTIGEGLRVDSAVTALRAKTGGTLDTDANADPASDVDGSRSRVRLPLSFEVILDVGVPNLAENTRDVISVSIEAPGEIEGCFTRELSPPESNEVGFTSVHVELDTHALLAAMIDRACAVVSRAVDNAAAAAASVSFLQAKEPVDQVSRQGEQAAPAASADDESGSHTTNVDGTAASPSSSDDDDDVDREAMPPPEPRAASVVSPPLGAVDAPANAAGKRKSDELLDSEPRDLDEGTSGDENEPNENENEPNNGGDTLPSAEDDDDGERCAAIVDYIMEEVDVFCGASSSSSCPTSWPRGGPCPVYNKRARRASYNQCASTTPREGPASAN